MKFIKLTVRFTRHNEEYEKEIETCQNLGIKPPPEREGEAAFFDVHINSDHIKTIYRTGIAGIDTSVVETIGGGHFHCKETVEELLNLLK